MIVKQVMDFTVSGFLRLDEMKRSSRNGQLKTRTLMVPIFKRRVNNRDAGFIPEFITGQIRQIFTRLTAVIWE